MAVVFLTRIQRGLYPIRMVGGVRILLALQTNTHVLGVDEAVLTCNLCVSTYTLEVAAINLNTRLVGEHFHKDTCLGRVEAGANLCVVTLTVLECVQAEIMIVTRSILNLVEIRMDAT